MKEKKYDDLLNINTRGNKSEVNHSTIYHPYEPTPYSALEELSKHYEVSEGDHLVDFGCGKGRLNFFLHYLYHATVTGIEMNEGFFHEALKNKTSYFNKIKRNNDRIRFYCCKAEEYGIQPEDNRFYFFNPFSIQIFIKVINNILRSVEHDNREIDLILYYASDDYRYYLEYETPFELVKEVELPDLYVKNTYERFLIYHLNKMEN